MVDPTKVEEVFWQAMRLTDLAERQSYLHTACGADLQLLERVSSLLRAGHEADRFLEAPACSRDNSASSSQSRESSADMSESFPFLSAAVDADDIGSLGNYRIQRCIGRGAMGIVFQAFDPKLHRVVAIKVLAPEIATDPNARKRFEREARSAAAISHPSVVVIHAVDELHRPPYLVMEYIQGKTLAQKLSTHGTLPIKEILRIGVQIGEGLSAAHKQGLVHRDIKPANILLENGIERVKVTDFGLAKIVNDSALTRDGQLSGTPNFMSPEQASGGIVDHRSDLFSFGAVLYAMCTGNPPFLTDNPLATLHRILNDDPKPIQQLNVDVPIWLSAIVDRLLAKSPTDRYQSAIEVARLLRKHLAQLQAGPIVSRQKDFPDKPSPSDSLRSRISSRFMMAMVLGLATTILLTFSVLGRQQLTTSSSPSKETDEAQENVQKPLIDVEEVVNRYANQCQLARDKMLLKFDEQIETTEKYSELEPAEKQSRVALLTAEKKDCANNGSMPFSPMMRTEAMAYLDDLKAARQSAIETLKKLSYEEFEVAEKRIAPVKVGMWKIRHGRENWEWPLFSNRLVGSGSGTWDLNKSALVFRWPKTSAPGGAWIDTCVVDKDGRRFSGANQRGFKFTGTKGD